MQLPVHDLLEAAHDEWLAARAALNSRRMEILDETRCRLEAGQDPDRDVLPKLFGDLSAEGIVDAANSFIVGPRNAMILGFVDGFPAAMIRRHLQLEFGEGICGTVARDERPIHLTDIQNSADPFADTLRASGIAAFACEPLLVGDRLLGTLGFATRRRRRFDCEDVHLFRSIAGHVALSRERLARAFEDRHEASAGSRAA
jgi:GAF domain-containing protein